MEATTAPVAGSTGSNTIADLMSIAAVKHADKVAVRHKVGDEWKDVTFAEVGEIVSEIGRGLIALGIQSGDRVCILCNTRPEWTYADFGITSTGAVVVPVYPTNSPEECEWVAGNSEAVAVVCEDAVQVAKIEAVRDRLPNLRTIVVIDPAGDVADAIAMDDVRARGARARSGRTGGAVLGHHVRRPLHLHLHLRHHRAAEGMRPHPRQLPKRHQHDGGARRAQRGRRGLPLPPARACLRDPHPAALVRSRQRDRLLDGRPAEDHPRAHGDQADLLPVGAAHLREALHARLDARSSPRCRRSSSVRWSAWV